MKRSFFLTTATFLLVSLFLGCVTQPQETVVTPGPASEPAALPPETLHGTLENGLTYYIHQNEHPENRIFFHLVVNAGSIQETEEQRGVAHFVEHMAFNGTKNFSQQALVDYFESIGMAFGDGLNAFTSFQETVYILEIPADDPEILNTTLQVLSDWMNGISFDPEEVEKERGVIQEEWRLRQNAQGRRSDFLLPAILENSGYAQRLPIGLPEVIQNVSPEELRDFYATWYIPSRMAVSIVGNLEPAGMEATVKTAFEEIWTPEELSDLEDSPANQWQNRPQPPYQGVKSFQWGDEEFPYDVIEIYAHQDIPEDASYSELARQSLLNSLTSTALGYRFNEATRNAQPPFLAASFDVQELIRGSNLVSFFAIAQNGDLTTALRAMLNETAGLEIQGIDQDELTRAKSDLTANLQAALEQVDKTESDQLIGNFSQHFLANKPFLGSRTQLETQLEILTALSVEDFNAHAAQVLSLENYRLMLSLSNENPQADLEALEQMVAQRAQGIQEAKSIEKIDTLIATPPQAGTITESTSNQKTGITTLRLGNGMTVHLRPSKETPGEILFSATSPGGLSLIPEENYWTGVLTTSLLSESGFEGIPYNILENYLADKPIGLQPFINDYSEGLSGSTRSNLQEVFFQLLHLELSQVQQDQDSLDSIMSRIHSSIVNRDQDPQTAFSDQINHLYGDGHPRTKPLNTETLAQADPEKSLSLYEDRFYAPSDFTLAFAGDFELDNIKELVRTYLASLPSQDKNEQAKDLGIRPAENTNSIIYRGIDERGLLFVAYNREIPLTPDETVLLEALREIASIRLRKEIREDKSASYGLSVSAGHQPIPYPDTWFSVSTGFEPVRRDEILTTIKEILSSLAQEPITSDELSTVIQVLSRQLEDQEKENSFWLSQIIQAASTNQSVPTIEQQYQWINQVTAGGIQQIAERIFLPDNSFSVTLLPEALQPE